jgi:hypothetical protein
MTKRKKSEGFVEEFGKGFAELVKFFSYKREG